MKIEQYTLFLKIISLTKGLIISTLFHELNAQEMPLDKNFNLRNEIELQTDNDVYFPIFSDRYYTNGLYLYFRRVVDDKKFKWMKGKKTIKFIYQIEGGQAIYNPQTPFVRKPLEQIDRPFAGLLYGGLSLSFFKINESALRFLLQIGTTGKASGAEKVQTWYHKTFGFDPPIGWQTQIQDELGVNLRVNWDRMVQRSINESQDWTIQTEWQIGSILSALKTGMLYRTGRLEKLYQSITNNNRIQCDNQAIKNENFFFFNPHIQWVMYNATLQGSIWNNTSPFTFEPRKIVLGLKMGYALAYRNFGWEMSVNVLTAETQTMNWSFFGRHRFLYRF